MLHWGRISTNLWMPLAKRFTSHVTHLSRKYLANLVVAAIIGNRLNFLHTLIWCPLGTLDLLTTKITAATTTATKIHNFQVISLLSFYVAGLAGRRFRGSHHPSSSPPDQHTQRPTHSQPQRSLEAGNAVVVVVVVVGRSYQPTNRPESVVGFLVWIDSISLQFAVIRVCFMIRKEIARATLKKYFHFKSISKIQFFEWKRVKLKIIFKK